MKNYFKLLQFLKDHLRLFSMAVVAMFVASLFEGGQLSLLVPLIDRIFNRKPIVVPNHLPPFLMHLVDKLNHMAPLTLFHLLPAVVVIMIACKQVTVYVYQYLMNDVSQRVMRDIRYRLYAKIQSLSLDYFSERRTGEMISRITNDVNIIESAVSYAVTDLFRQTFLIIIYTAIAFSIHMKAALAVFFVFPALALPIRQIGRKLRKLSRIGQERMADINSLLLETITGVRVVKAFCNEAYEVDRFKAKNQDYYGVKMKSVQRTLLVSPLTEMFGAVCGVIVILWLGKEVMAGDLSFGVFVLFLGAILSLISPLKKLGTANALTQQALAANARIYAILDLDPTVREAARPKDIPPLKDRIVFEDVAFRYDPHAADVLKDIRLTIKAGELVAIVGPTGTGKSTLVNLIPRFYDATAGRVTFDGRDVKEASFASLRSQIGIVAQETFLFNDTVAANIAYGRRDATPEEIEEAARKAYAHRFIVEMPNRYATVIGERGFRLSGGEKQRVTIARAILNNPPVLILDEATSQLDSESEKYVQEALDELMRGRTVIAIAHRLSTIMQADKIVVLDQGRITGEGRHEELLRTCPLYKRLYETQFHS